MLIQNYILRQIDKLTIKIIVLKLRKTLSNMKL